MQATKITVEEKKKIDEKIAEKVSRFREVESICDLTSAGDPDTGNDCFVPCLSISEFDCGGIGPN